MSKPEIGKAKTKKKTNDHANEESPDPMTRWMADLLSTQPFEKVKNQREETGTRTICNSD